MQDRAVYQGWRTDQGLDWIFCFYIFYVPYRVTIHAAALLAQSSLLAPWQSLVRFGKHWKAFFDSVSWLRIWPFEYKSLSGCRSHVCRRDFDLAVFVFSCLDLHRKLRYAEIALKSTTLLYVWCQLNVGMHGLRMVRVSLTQLSTVVSSIAHRYWCKCCNEYSLTIGVS